MTGMNLPMLMNLFLFSNEPAKQLIHRLNNEAKCGIVYCNEKVQECLSEEDEF